MSRQLTVSNLRERVTYDPLTGVLLRTCHWNPKHKDDMKLGSVDNYGYIKTKVDGITKGLHQIAWFLMTNEWSTLEIDHINGNPGDNRWENLRQVTHQQNLSNRANVTKTNKHGCVGVSFKKDKKKYKAYHTQLGKQHHIGYYVKLQDAIAAREAYLAGLAP